MGYFLEYTVTLFAHTKKVNNSGHASSNTKFFLLLRYFTKITYPISLADATHAIDMPPEDAT